MATSVYGDADLTQLRAHATDAQALAEVLADPRIGEFRVTTVIDETEHEVRRRVDDFLAAREPATW